MSISLEEFNEQCEAFCQLDDIRDDGWMLCQSHDISSSGVPTVYARKESHVIPSRISVDTDIESSSAAEYLFDNVQWDVEESDHEAQQMDRGMPDAISSNVENMGSRATGACLLEFEVHIAYSEMFCVPVLYFRVTKKRISDGKTIHLTNDDVFREIVTIIHHHERHDEMASSHVVPQDVDPWTFVTQGEHPVLGTVFHYVHPCQTRDVMDQVQSVDWDVGEDQVNFNYILSWLSTYGSVIGLHVPRRILQKSKRNVTI